MPDMNSHPLKVLFPAIPGRKPLALSLLDLSLPRLTGGSPRIRFAVGWNGDSTSRFVALNADLLGVAPFVLRRFRKPASQNVFASDVCSPQLVRDEACEKAGSGREEDVCDDVPLEPV